jgi:hypothetical protein
MSKIVTLLLCPFGDGSLLEPRVSRGSLQALRPLAEGTQPKCRRTDKLSYATGIMAAAIIRPEVIHT